MTSAPFAAAKWKWCAAASLAMLVLSLLPQLHLWILRGGEWNGAYVRLQGDEPLYSAYVNSLIQGRTRKNDPFGGKDSSISAPLPESIFSIQFVPAYAIALPARILGVSASSAFIVLIGVAALLSSLAVFWLLYFVTNDHRLAFAGTLMVLCLSGLIGSYGIFDTPIDIAYPVVPFLRRYQPAAAFPLLFVFQILVWTAFTNDNPRVVRAASLLAGLVLAVLIFSYLYLWTAAAAWFVSMGSLWLWLRRSDRRKCLLILTTVGVITAFALVPYAYMLAQRAPTLDQQQILISTHKPDLTRAHEILAGALIVALVVGIRRGKFEKADPRVVFVASLALLPFLVFNQQVITGKTMQVFHYEIFAVNYSTMLGFVIIAHLFGKPGRRGLIWIGAISLAWGLIAVGLPSRLVHVPISIANDNRVPVLKRLNELSRQDGTLEDLRTKGETSNLVYSSHVGLIALLPTWTSHATLLDITGVDCGTITQEERKQFFFMHLYYSGVEIELLRRVLSGIPEPTHDELSSARSIIFGHIRIFPGLSSEFKPVESHEIEHEIKAYESYISSFSLDDAQRRVISYAVVPGDGNFDFSNLDRWYERDAGEQVGQYTLYRLKLRD